MIKQIHILGNAMLYYTRIPMPKNIQCNAENLSKAFRYFPLIGGIVGGVGAIAYSCANLFLSPDISVVFAMIAMVLTTGCLHEDGLADFCDGFGAGRDKDAILRIMKDSHIGTYGVVALILLFILKYSLLTEVWSFDMIWILILGQAASRFAPVLMVRVSRYARSENSKSMHTTLGVDTTSMIIATITAYAPLLILGWKLTLVYIVANLILFTLFKIYIHKRIGGFTGDTLGALQQLSELLFYSVYLSLCGL